MGHEVCDYRPVTVRSWNENVADKIQRGIMGSQMPLAQGVLLMDDTWRRLEEVPN